MVTWLGGTDGIHDGRGLLVEEERIWGLLPVWLTIPKVAYWMMSWG